MELFKNLFKTKEPEQLVKMQMNIENAEEKMRAYKERRTAFNESLIVKREEKPVNMFKNNL